MTDQSRKIITPSPLYKVPLWIAHTPRKNGKEFHSLVSHTLEVARLASEFAHDLGPDAPAIAYYLGILHDLGKFTPDFQEYLMKCYMADLKKGDRPEKGSAPHKQHGAVAAVLLEEHSGEFFRLPLFGHHGGMKSPANTDDKINEVRIVKVLGKPGPEREQIVEDLLALAKAVDPRLEPVVPDTTALRDSPLWAHAESREMYLRLLFSCLTDADARDTEAHTNPSNAQARAADPRPSLATLRDTLIKRQITDFAKTQDTAVNLVRRQVYADCRRVGANSKPGFFDLTVPTGGAKTRSSLAFALEHACANGMRRVIYGIPYTSIIDQTVGVFHSIFGDAPGTVLEHHSAVDPPQKGKAGASEDEEDREQKAEQWRLLASEDWDAPVICTTTLQLFESLFSNRPGACRKLHRLANSVTILDEAQCLPPELLGPIRSGLKILVEHFGATVVFCTATQPAHEVKSRWLDGITTVPIVSDPQPHFTTLRRVTWTYAQEPWDWPRVAREMLSKPTSCITVVNTRKQALDLIAALQDAGASPDELLHLSTLLCGAHRRKVIATVKELLKAGKRTLLVSTQVIEAGVDLSAPRLFRAIGPLERIIQAAGRCNREGELGTALGEVTIFTPADPSAPRGFYERALSRTENLLGAGPVDFDDPAFVTTYFANLYTDLRGQADLHKINVKRAQYRFDEVAQLFRMINDDTVSVFTTGYETDEAPSAAHDALNEVRDNGRVTRDQWRKAQPYTVSLYRHEVDKLPQNTIAEEAPGFFVWQGQGDKQYDPLIGIPLSIGIADLTMPSASSVV